LGRWFAFVLVAVQSSAATGSNQPKGMYLSCWQETNAASSPISACAGNANQLDPTARSDRVLLRRGHKPLVAPLGAEVIGLSPVLLTRSGRGRVDLHPAHRVCHRCHHFPLPSLVGPGNHASAVQWNKTTSWPSRLTPGCRPVVDRRTEHAGRRGPPNGATRRSSSPPTTSSSTSTSAAAEPFVGA
jgi:hypothetical protein